MAFDRYDFYKTLYLNEVERRENQETRLNTPLAVIVLLGGILGLFIRDYRFGALDIVEFMFVFLVLLALAGYAFAIYFLVRSYHSKRYLLALVPTSSEFEEWRERLRSQEPDSVEEKFEEGVIDSFLEPTAYNRAINNIKAGYFHRAKASLIVTTVLCGLSLIPFSIRTYERGESIYKVELVQPGTRSGNTQISEDNMQDRTLQANTAGNKTDSGTSQQAVKKPSPPPPPTQYINESSGKTVPKPVPNGDRR